MDEARPLSPSLPGTDLVHKGLADLQRGLRSKEACLVSMAATRLRSLGHQVHGPIECPETELHALLTAELGDGAHSRYNALRRRLSSYLRAASCERR